MPLHATLHSGRLDSGYILAPERYDPRRLAVRQVDGTTVGDIVSVGVRGLSVSKMDSRKLYLVIDTGDSADGLIRPRNDPVEPGKIGSAKKILRTGDVIISRLRPYLRQVALVDSTLAEHTGAELVGSTEYFVLRPKKDGRSVAFLVPFLLSKPPQHVLCAAQEGGHHPRFSKETLLTLPIPKDILKIRDEISANVESAARVAREALLRLEHLTNECDRLRSEESAV